MIRTLSGLIGMGGLLAFTAVADAQPAAPTTAREIFTPVENDLALTNLRKLLGCTVDGVWKAAACADDRPLTVALGYFNVACLIVATVLACYLLYSLVADTANDGEPFGRGTDGKWTLLRVLAGAVLALPVKSGLSLIQILVIQIAVWGSGFADTLWNRVAATQLSGMYGSFAIPEPREGDFILRGKLAKALEGRVYGYVCKAALEDYAKNISGATSGSPANIIAASSDDNASFFSSTSRSRTYFFRDAGGYFRKSDNLCGAIKYEYVRLDPKLEGNDASASQALLGLADEYGQRSVERAMDAIDASARTIAQAVTAGDRDDGAIRTRIGAAVDAAVTAANQSMLQAQTGQLQSVTRNYLSSSTQNGWLSAALWQRSMSAIYARILTASAAASGTISVVPPADLRSYIPLLDRSGSAYQALADKAQRDIAYVESLGGYFAAQGTGSPSVIASDSAGKAVDPTGVVGKAVAWIYAKIFSILSRPDAASWRDPILEAQEIGESIAYMSAGMAGVGAGIGFVGDLAGKAGPIAGAFGAAGSGFGSFLTLIGAILFAAAFLLSGVVPFVIIVHFLLAAFNWFLVVAEAMVAVPVWLLTKFMPSRGDGFVGRSGQGYLFFLGILLRPPLIVVGFLLALLLMRLGFDIASLFFRGALGMLAPDGGVASIMLGAAGILTYATVLFVIILLAAGQISALPETVLGWLGSQVERRIAGTAAGQAAATMLPASAGALAGGRAATGMLRGQSAARASTSTVVGRILGSKDPSPGSHGGAKS